MSKTVMSKFSNQFKIIKKIFSSVGISELNLNKSEPKYTWWTTYSQSFQTKGVDSDFIRIYTLIPGGEKKTSIAFSFNNIKQDPFILATVKKGEKITSAKFSIESFKKTLNDFVNVLSILKKSNDDLFSEDKTVLDVQVIEKLFVNAFIKNKEYDGKDDIKKAVDEALSLIKKETKRFSKKVFEYNEVVKLKKDIEHKINQDVEKEKEKVGLNFLKNEYEKALNKVNRAKEKSEMRYKISEIKKREGLLRIKKFELEGKVSSIIKEVSNNLPKNLRKEVENKIKKEMEKNNGKN